MTQSRILGVDLTSDASDYCLQVPRLDQDVGDRLPAFTDEAVALQFAETHGAELRFVAAWGKWLTFDGVRWVIDDTLAAFDKVRGACREAAASCNESRQVSSLASAKTVAAVEKLAKADRRLAATTGMWDSDPWLLNTPTGVVDLRNGARRAHRPGDHMTKVTAVGAGGDCPTWRAFLRQITAGDADLQEFLQRVAGYALTGLTVEQALFFIFGNGANGKSVWLNTVSWIAGDYAKTAPIETFTVSTGDRHPTELAGLRGARLVSAVETEEGRRWAESRIKSLTGGDTVSARFMRQDFFEFTPQFKLLIAGNHKPGLRSVDEAIRRRFHLIPFSVTIPPEQRDAQLAEKLKAEGSGILQWAIDGCLKWQSTGLCPPAAVRDATDAYLEAEDALGAWMDECCYVAPNLFEHSSELFQSWKSWADAAGEYVGSAKKLSQNLENRGFQRQHTKRGTNFLGLRLKAKEPYG